MGLITTAELEPWVGKAAGTLTAHPFALAVIEQASRLVKGRARQPDWTSVDAPDEAKDITIQVAARVFQNPRMVAARGAGPITERLAAELLTGMGLTPDEINRLHLLRPNVSTGLWIVPTYPDRNANPEPYGIHSVLADGSLDTTDVSYVDPWDNLL